MSFVDSKINIVLEKKNHQNSRYWYSDEHFLNAIFL